MSSLALLQVVVGSFNAEGGARKEQSKAANQIEPFLAPPKLAPGPASGLISADSPAWGDGTPSRSSDGPASPLNQTMGHNTGVHGLSGLPWK